MKKCILLLIALPLAACQHYVAPENKETARLVFTSDDLVAQPLICQEGKWRPTEYSLGRTGTKLQDDMNEALKKKTEVETQVPASAPLVIGFKHSATSNTKLKTRCQASAAFTPQAGAHYQAHLTKTGLACDIEIVQLQPESTPEALVTDAAPRQCP